MALLWRTRIDPLLGISVNQLPQISPLTQAIRYHATGERIHFHADAEGLMVVVPAAEWWAAWERLKCGEGFRFIDRSHGSVLVVAAGVTEKGEFEVVPHLSKLSEEGHE